MIADLHCDLLSYLAGDPKRTPYDPISRCAIPQLQEGKVKLQTLAIFTLTNPHSVKNGMAQAKIFKDLPTLFPEAFSHIDASNRIKILMAFENASGFCSEEESLTEGMNRLQTILKEIGKPLYISLTWNMENRFGGGASTNIGLKEDGKRLLDFMHINKIPIDFSHTSDRLAHDIFNYIDSQNLNLSVLASHSNARHVTEKPRNLPNDIAKEIFHRQGVVGLNFYRHFVGEKEEDFIKHIVHWLEIGGEKQICFGADFFYDDDLPTAFRHDDKMFFPNYAHAGSYGRLLEMIKKHLNLKDEILEGLAHKNFHRFYPTTN